MPERKLSHILPLSIILLALSFVGIVVSKQADGGHYYKSYDVRYNDLTSITNKEQWISDENTDVTKLLAKKKAIGNFTAKSDNLGIIAVPFDTRKRSIEDKIVFRLKKTGEKNWYYQGTYNTNQIQNNIPFPFGFPVIKNSNNISYTFEIESLGGTADNSLSLDKTDRYFFSKYKFLKSELARNPYILSQFIVAKTTEQIGALTIAEAVFILFSFLLPLILYLIIIFIKKNKKFFINLIINYKYLIPHTELLTAFSKKIFKNLILTKKLILISLDRKEKIGLCSLIMCANFFLNLFFHYWEGSYHKLGYPFNTFLPTGWFGDFTLYTSWSIYQFNGVGYAFSYFPGMYLGIDLLNKIFGKYLFQATIAYLSFFALFLFWYTYKNVKTDSILESLKNAFIISLMSYPYLFTSQTANPEIITFIFVCLFFIYYKKSRLVSNISLAYATSTKLFPGIFIILLLLEKRYKDIFLVSMFTILFTLLPLVIYDGGFNKGIGNYLDRFKASQNMYIQLMVIGGAGGYYGHSLLNGINTFLPGLLPPTKTLMFPYSIFAFVIFIAVVIYLILFEKTFWKRVAVLVMMMNLLPYTSTDYKLLYIFLPLFFLINHLKKDKHDGIFIVLLSSLLISKDYFYFNNNPSASFTIVGNTFIMSAILLLIIISGITSNLPRINKGKYIQ